MQRVINDHSISKLALKGHLVYLCAIKFFQIGKTTAIRRIAHRETSISRHHKGLIEGPSETPGTTTALWY